MGFCSMDEVLLGKTVRRANAHFRFSFAKAFPAWGANPLCWGGGAGRSRSGAPYSRVAAAGGAEPRRGEVAPPVNCFNLWWFQRLLAERFGLERVMG